MTYHYLLLQKSDTRHYNSYPRVLTCQALTPLDPSIILDDKIKVQGHIDHLEIIGTTLKILVKYWGQICHYL